VVAVDGPFLEIEILMFYSFKFELNILFKSQRTGFKGLWQKMQLVHNHEAAIATF
jgi:hypothetical protein